MTPEQIIEIITRRMDKIVKDMFPVSIHDTKFAELSHRLDELTNIVKEIQSLNK